MAKAVIMPALGMAQESGVLVAWLKAEGDTIAKGEPLMEIETDKVTVEIEAPASGILANVTAQNGDEVPVGETIALILAEGESAPRSTIPSPAESDADTSLPVQPLPAISPLAARIADEHQVDLNDISTAGGRIQKEDVLAYLDQTSHATAEPEISRIPASPKARRLAHEQGMALASINGSGPEGAVLVVDVQTAIAATARDAEAAIEASGDMQPIPVGRMWQTMAQRLTESRQTVPDFNLERDVDASQLLEWLEGVRRRISETITVSDLLVKITAGALRLHPRVNAMWQNGEIIGHAQINVGLAVAVDDGLLVPVIRQADQQSLAALSAHRQALVDDVRSGTIDPQQLRHGTFTISNLGMYGVDTFNAIINPPQAAILAVGRITDRVVAIEGQAVVQPRLTLNLCCDHRVIDGAIGARFLQSIVQMVENPLAVID